MHRGNLEEEMLWEEASNAVQVWFNATATWRELRQEACWESKGQKTFKIKQESR